MNRKEFIQSCTFSCLGLLGAAALLQNCTPSKYIQVSRENDQLKVAKSEFVNLKKNKTSKYLIVKANTIPYPIVVYRFSDTDYTALLLQCSHQGSELNVNGDILTCPAHGSEFGNKGEVIQGPADQKLQNYKVTSDADHIYINLA